MSRQLKIIIASVIGIAAVLAFVYTLVRAIWFVPDSASYAPSGVASSSAIAALPPAEKPTRLRIPAINVDANVQYVGVAKTGAMGVPNNFTDTAWYQYGTVPGQKGSAVIDGHVDNGLSLPGVFKHLDQVKPGDDIYVQTVASSTLHFVVTEVESYPMDAVPLDRLFNATDGEYLNLITCTGAWVESGRTYDHRLVVYSRLVQ